MALSPGTRLGPYEIAAPLGAGGMGEVYRAKDTRLGREVAIKVLPAEVAGDAERLARFRREAHVLASLNHPGVAAIYGLEEADSKPFLVLELVEGETLQERMGRGRIPLEEALPVARQIAEALEEAHEHGIAHRDLKPANVKLTAEGKAKVLDFGLAKAYAGTTGRTLAAVLKTDPDWRLLPTETPQGIRNLLGRCLTRDPHERLRDIGDARIEIASATLEEPVVPTLSARPSLRGFVGAAILGFLAGAITIATGLWSVRPPAAGPATPVTRLSIPLPPAVPLQLEWWPGMGLAILLFPRRRVARLLHPRRLSQEGSRTGRTAADPVEQSAGCGLDSR